MPSYHHEQARRHLHVAIIMDGNGRWAEVRGLSRDTGHHAGVGALREIVEAAPRLGITMLTVYAFSVDNWRRPASEVATLMEIFRLYLQNELARMVRTGIRFKAIGRRDRLPDGLAYQIKHAEAVTAEGGALELRLAIDYSARDAILSAAQACDTGSFTRDELSRRLAGGAPPADVDLMIRTSGEKRLSDFLLWEAAYAELYFTDRLWPDFRVEDLQHALDDFRARNRRFGALAPHEPPSATYSEVETIPAATQNLPIAARAMALIAGRSQ